MKRIINCLIGIILLSACSHIEQSVPEDNFLNGDIVKKVVFDVLPIKDGDDPETKASAVPSADGKTVEFAWELDDMVGIYPDKGSQIYFKIEDGAGSSSASFDGGGWALKQNSTYVSYYPFVADFFLSRDAIPISFSGQKQVGTTPPFSGAKYVLASAPATSENGVLRFTYSTLNTIINVNATLPAGTYTKASLTVDEPLFKEEGTFSLDEMEIVGTKFSNTLEIELENVTLTEEGTIPIYIMSAPVDLSGKDVVVRIQSSEGKTYKCVKNPSKEYLAGTRYGLTCAMQIDQPNNVIYYTSTDGSIVTPYKTDVFGANIISNKYVDGIGVLAFDGDVTCIGESAFYSCYNLASITLPDCVSSVGKFAFYDNCYLTSIILPETITSIGRMAFRGCQGLASITLPNNITSIGEFAFTLCTSLTNVIIPESVTSIGEAAFAGCISLESFGGKFASTDGLLLLDSGVINSVALGGLGNSYTVPDGVTSIGEDAFRYSSLTDITLPNSLIRLGKNAFYQCTNLISITIPVNVTDLSGVSFGGCSSLTSIIVLPLTPPSAIGGGMFEDTNSCPIYVPAESVDTYKAAEGWSEYADRIQAIPDNVFFADENFKAYCVKSFDTDGDGEVSREEALAVTSINVRKMDITSLQGVECFMNLKSLDCSSNHLSSLDFSGNTALQYLYCDSNQLSSLDVCNCTALERLNCDSNQLSSLDVSNNTALTSLNCDSNQLSSLDVSNNTALTSLNCGSNQLSSLDVSNNTALTSLYCYSNQLSSLDVSNCTALQFLSCCNDPATPMRNQLSSLDVSNNTALEVLKCDLNQLIVLNVSNSIALTLLSCDSNQLSSLDVSNCSALESLGCGSNQLSGLDVSNCTALKSLYCDSNQLSSLDVSKNTALQTLWCYSNPYLTEIWLKTGQSVNDLSYDTNIATIKYKPEAVDLGLPSGLKWASFNLGASRPEEYGDYYAWGETEPYYSCQNPLTWKDDKKNGYFWSSYKWCMGDDESMTKYCKDSTYGYNGFTDNNTVLYPEDDAANVDLSGNWRMPTIEEWTELRENCTWTWVTQNGVNGYLITASNSNSIFLPATGSRSRVNLSDVGSIGSYWSSSLGVGSDLAALVQFGSGNVNYGVYIYRYYGLCIRPVSD